MTNTMVTPEERERAIAEAGMLAILFSPEPFDFYFDAEFDKDNKSDIFGYAGTVCAFNRERETIDQDKAMAELKSRYANF